MKFTRGLAAASFVVALLPASVALAEDSPGFKELTYERGPPTPAPRRFRTTLHVRSDGTFTVRVDNVGKYPCNVLDKTGWLDQAERTSLASAFAAARLASLPSDLRPPVPTGLWARFERWGTLMDATPYSLSADGGTAHTGCLGVPRDEATAKRIDPLLNVLEGIVLDRAGLLPSGKVAFVELSYRHQGPEKPKDEHRKSFTLRIEVNGRVSLEGESGAALTGYLDGETMNALAEARRKAGQFKVNELTYVGPRECDGDGAIYFDVVNEVEKRPNFFLRIADDDTRGIWRGETAVYHSPLIHGCLGLYRDERMRERVEPLVTLLEQIAARLAESAKPTMKPAPATTGITSSVPH
jgi:hypothetical protein